MSPCPRSSAEDSLCVPAWRGGGRGRGSGRAFEGPLWGEGALEGWEPDADPRSQLDGVLGVGRGL